MLNKLLRIQTFEKYLLSMDNGALPTLVLRGTLTLSTCTCSLVINLYIRLVTHVSLPPFFHTFTRMSNNITLFVFTHFIRAFAYTIIGNIIFYCICTTNELAAINTNTVKTTIWLTCALCAAILGSISIATTHKTHNKITPFGLIDRFLYSFSRTSF